MYIPAYKTFFCLAFFVSLTYVGTLLITLQSSHKAIKKLDIGLDKKKELWLRM